MTLCISCSSEINDVGQYYECSDMGPEIISTIEGALGHEVDENGSMCEHCFANILQIMSAAPENTSSAHEEYELQHRYEHNCVWCKSLIIQRHTHNLPDRERQFIAERIQRNVPDGSVVCSRCWLRVRQALQQQKVALPPENSVTSTHYANTCLWCLRSLARTRRHSLPEGPERNEIISRIFPREAPAEACVCYACWVAARRNVQRAQNIDEARTSAVSASHHQDVSCALCSISLFRRQTHILPSGEERDALAASIYPRELSGRLLCTNCWSINLRRIAQVGQENVQLANVEHMDLNEFKHTTSSSRHCFVPSCTNTERFRVPIYIRKQILKTQKVFVTDNARVCYEHKSLFNWEFLKQHQFSNTFTKTEMQSMLQLSV